MSENLIINSSADKREKYNTLIPQLKALVQDETDVIANLSNLAAALKQAMAFFWVGFYLVKENQLVLGPFQGPIACTRIDMGKGVCGTAWQKKETIVVKDVEKFPGHIACSSMSRSEIVLPALRNGEVFLVLDVDSDVLNDFDETDKSYLEEVIRIIESFI
jgi:L-methionine (R)-S-oxide reductase